MAHHVFDMRLGSEHHWTSYLLNSAEPLEESATLRVDVDMQVPISYSPEVRPDSPVVDGHATQLSFLFFG